MFKFIKKLLNKKREFSRSGLRYDPLEIERILYMRSIGYSFDRIAKIMHRSPEGIRKLVDRFNRGYN
jgi:hypothetical protein